MRGYNKEIILATKQIKIVSFLYDIGKIPVRETSLYALYHAPYRIDRNPSFIVYKENNRWADLAKEESGDIIDLVKILYGLDFIGSITLLNGKRPSIDNPYVDSRKTNLDCCDNNTFKDIVVGNLQQSRLLHYLATRRINLDIAVKYCVEVRFKYRDKQYSAVGFKNIKIGYEVRNSAFKSCFGSKDISWIRQPNNRECCLVFEGFIDFLSYMTLSLCDVRFPYSQKMDFIVLNSVSLVKHAIKYLNQYKSVYCYLDNDDAGKRATMEIISSHPNVFDASFQYFKFNDLNDYLTVQSK